MASPKTAPEEPVTARDLRNKWDEIKQAARRETEHRVLGMTALTLGGMALGVGALGAAFWLGRRSASHRHAAAPREEAAESAPLEAAQAEPRRRSSTQSRALEPALNTAVNALVNAAVKSAVNALTNRLRT